jgi:hypothetical protein
MPPIKKAPPLTDQKTVLSNIEIEKKRVKKIEIARECVEDFTEKDYETYENFDKQL